MHKLSDSYSTINPPCLAHSQTNPPPPPQFTAPKITRSHLIDPLKFRPPPNLLIYSPFPCLQIPIPLPTSTIAPSTRGVQCIDFWIEIQFRLPHWNRIDSIALRIDISMHERNNIFVTPVIERKKVHSIFGSRIETGYQV